MLSANLTSLVSKGTRERGRAYFLSRRVTSLKGDAWHVDATVRGSQLYDVKLRREGEAIEAWCSCPYCEGYSEPCKHIWATLLAAEAAGHLRGDGKRTVRQLTLVDPDEEDDLGNEELNEPLRPSRPRGNIADSGPRPRHPRDATPAWKKILSRMHPTTEPTPASRAVALAPGHELIYIVDVPASLAGNGLVLEVATRHRKKDGEWSKPKGRRLAANEIAHLPEPADRRAMSILAGGREQVSSYYSSYGYGDYAGAPARYQLTHSLSEALLPTLCATGRCLLRESETDGAMRPLRWDDAGPWEFWLRVTPDEAGRTYGIAGELREARSDCRYRRPSCC